MPVLDLRDTLGLAAQAPQQPAFQRTRQLAAAPQNAYESALQFEQQAPLVQANQGLAYLGAIQNQQAQIAQQAQNLRMQQEAQMAAERATQGLAGITPDHPEYLQQRQQILQQNPNALLDPQFRNALGIYDQGYTQIAHQRQLQAAQQQAQQKQAQSLGLRAIEYGAHPDQVAEHVQNGNIGALAQLAGQARRDSVGRGSTSIKSPELTALKDNFDLVAKERNQFIKDGAEVPADIEKEYQETKKMLVGARKSIYLPKGEASSAPASATVEKAAPTAEIKVPAPIAEHELANVPFAEIGKAAAQKKAENEEIHRVNHAWTDAKNELESKLKTVVPDAPFEGTDVNQLDRFAKAVLDGENVNPEPGSPYIGQEFNDRVPVWQPILNKLKLTGEAFKNPDSAILSKTSVPYDDLIKAWAQDRLNRRGKLLPTAESMTGSVPTEKDQSLINDLTPALKSAATPVATKK